MYSTFPPGVIPGIAPGHLFASTPYGTHSSAFLGHSSGGYLPGQSLFHPSLHNSGYLGTSTAHGQKLNFSNPDHSGTTTTESQHASSSFHPAQQEMFLMLQTMYHQQQVLQSQMNQLCLSVQHLQSSMSILLSSSISGGGGGAGIGASSTQLPSQLHSSRSQKDSQERRESSSDHQTAQSDQTTSAPERPTTPPAQVHPTHLFVASSASTADAVSLDPNPHRSPSKRGLASPPRPAATAPSTTDITNAIFQSSSVARPYDEPHSQMSRNSTPPRKAATTSTPITNVPPSPQQVVVSWDPKKYSRSSSVGSGGSHNTSSVVAPHAQQVPTVVLGGARSSGRSASQQSDQQDATARQRPYASLQQQHHSYTDDRDHIESTSTLPPYHSSTADGVSSEPYQQQSAYLPRHAPKILERVFGGNASHNSSASDVRAHAGVQSSRYNASATTTTTTAPSSTTLLPPRNVSMGGAAYTPSYHDVSLSDDGYMSMDSAQYMQRFHLK